jgi:chemotaxis signal transduction protein
VEALSLASTQSYSVSEFAPSVLYEGTPGLIYAAAVRSPEGRTVGVVGVVFDTAPQLRAMLRDALPRDAAGEPLPGCVAAFLDSRLQLMAATVPDFQLDGLDLEWVRRVARDGDARVVRIGLRYFAVGVRPDTGYREYRGIGGCAVTLIPVGEVPHRRAAQQIPEARIARVSGTKRDLAEFATFAIGESWYALPAFHVIEAIDAKGLQPLPSRQSWCAGLIMFEGEPIAAADVGALLGSKEVGSGSVVVVLRAPSSGKPIGILADALGQICEIPRERLLPIGDPERVLTPFAIEPEDASGRLVLVMNPQRLEALIRGESQANAA